MLCAVIRIGLILGQRSKQLLGTAIGSMVGGTFKLALGVAATAAQTIAAVAPIGTGGTGGDAKSGEASPLDIAWNNILQQARKLFGQAVQSSSQSGSSGENSSQGGLADAAQNLLKGDVDFESLLDKVIRKGKSAASEAGSETVVDALTARGLSREEAAKTIDRWQQAYEKAKAEAEEMAAEAAKKARAIADQTAEAMSAAALWAFCALLLGAVAAAMGGAAGRPRTPLTPPL